jgi:hypothetical protein|tara:strand:- start:274 stop:465 length:192 start_codon:yes stop_codon:yes gene_type:complete
MRDYKKVSIRLCKGGEDTAPSTWALLAASETIKTQPVSSTMVIHWKNLGLFDKPLKGISFGSL